MKGKLKRLADETPEQRLKRRLPLIEDRLAEMEKQRRLLLGQFADLILHREKLKDARADLLKAAGKTEEKAA